MEVALREWPNKVLSEIAKQVGCTHPFVLTVQNDLVTSNKLTLPAKRLERGDIRKAVEVALREWPNKTLQAIAEQVGCSIDTASRYQKQLSDIGKLILPAKRIGKDGKSYPTAYATKTPTSATFNPVLDGGGAHVSNSTRGPFQAWALDCDCAQRAGTSARTSCRTSAAVGIGPGRDRSVTEPGRRGAGGCANGGKTGFGQKWGFGQYWLEKWPVTDL